MALLPIVVFAHVPDASAFSTALSNASNEELSADDGAVGSHEHPVTALVVELFYMSGPYGAGNRGWDYLVFPNQPVSATAPGTVVFAGPVAGERYVTVLHPDGIRSSYSYLSRIDVKVGQQVSRGEILGSASHRFQIGFRRGNVYLDPATLISVELTAKLVE